MLGTGSWGKELGGGSIDIDFNLLSGSWEVHVALFFLRWRLDVVRESGFSVFCGLFIKTFHCGGLRGVASDGDGAF